MPTWFGWHHRSTRADCRSRCVEHLSAVLGAAPPPSCLAGSLLAEFEQSLCHPPDLVLLGTFGDSVAAVMSVDVLERLMTAVTEAAENLHGAVGGVADQSVRAIVGHRHFVGHLHVVVAVQVPGRVLHQQPHHLRFGLQLGQRPLHSLVDRQRLPEHRTLAGLFGGTVNTVLRRAEAAGRLPNPVLVHERLGNLQPEIHFTEYRVGRNAVMPRAYPGSPDVREKIKSWEKRATPVLNPLEPLINHSSPSGFAYV